MIKQVLLMVLLAAPLNVWAETSAEKGRAIAVEADRRDSGFDDFTATMQMELINRRGKKSIRTMRQKTLEGVNDGDKAVIIFDYPKNIKGTSLLTHSHTDDDDQWLYLPKRGRVKRIASTNKSGAFVGSEFAYEDMSSQEVEKYTDYNYLRDEQVNGLDCFVIQRSPTDQDNSGYTKQVLWLDKGEYRVQKIDYYDLKSTLLKTLVFKGYNQYIDRYWRAGRMEMINHVTGKSTNLLWSDFVFRVGLKDKEFRKKGLARGR